jgi:hypothetical protein
MFLSEAEKGRRKKGSVLGTFVITESKAKFVSMTGQNLAQHKFK